jgi:LysR family transcriptional regulator, hydrogen peroxide-inducible genes activator
MMTLKQLRYLGALAEHRHFGKAAESCAVTQPALSMQIRELEKDLGVDLVERRPGEVMLTEVGAEVVRRAEHVLAAARDLADFARHSGRVLTGRLRLGVIPTLAPYMLPQILPALQQRFPDARIELRETQTRSLIEELARGALDAILLALPIEEDEFETLALFEDPFLLAVPAAEARAARVMIEKRAIDPRRLILLEEGHCLRDQALAFCGARIESASGLGRSGLGTSGLGTSGLGTSGLGATSLSTVMQMVANGYGVTLLPRIALPVEARDARVKVLRFRAPVPARQIGLAWRRTSPRKADFAALGRIVREQFAA